MDADTATPRGIRRPRLVIADLTGTEGLVIQLAAEYLGWRVDHRAIGTPVDLLDALGEKAELTVVSAHGDDRGILIPELSPEIAARQPFIDR